MIWVDFVVACLVLICVISGLLRGFSGEVFACVNWVLATSVALNFDKNFVKFMPIISEHPATRMASAFIALLLITLALGTVIGILLGTLANGFGVSIFSRLNGMVIGAVRSLIVITVLVMLAGVTSLPKDAWWHESKLLPIFQLLAVGLRDHTSSGIRQYVNYR
jgi:membrane protein required for colicin V production